MSHRHIIHTSDLGFFSYVPPQEQDTTTTFAETTGIAQPVLEVDLVGPITAIGWDSAATLPNPPHEGVTFAFGNIEAAEPVAFNPAFYFSDSHPNILNGVNLDFLDPWFMPTPYKDSTASSPNHGPRLLQSRSETATRAAQHDVNAVQAIARVPTLIHRQAPVLCGPFTFTPTITSPAELAPAELARISDPDQVMRQGYPADGSATRQIPQEHDAGFFGTSGPASNPSLLRGWGAAGLFAPTRSATTTPARNIFASSQTVLDKRHDREDDNLEDRSEEITHGHWPSPCKKCKVQMTTKPGALEAGGSTKRTHLSPVTGTHTGNRLELEAAGGGAERLAALCAQGDSEPSLQGPSVQQGSTGAFAQEQLPWVEGSVEAAMQHQIDSMMPQEEKTLYNAEAQGTLFYIPRRLDKRYRALLQATSDDWARGAIRMLKCRLCPGAGFSNWRDFKRHCREMEAHPVRISFCDHCGDFFARDDSLKRHCKSRPPECREVSTVMADTKRRETKKAHKDFKERLKRCLITGEGIGRPFAQIIKEMYPKSSKRGSRQQNRLQKPRSRS